MPRTIALFALVLSSMSAALVLAARPAPAPVPAQVPAQVPVPAPVPSPVTTHPGPSPVAVTTAGGLRLSTQLERRYLAESGLADAYLEIDLAASGERSQLRRVPVNAVLIVDRSGSMAGEKIERARDAARALIAALDGEDRLAIVDFASDAHVLFSSAAATAGAKERALRAVELLQATTGTNMSAALELAAPELRRGHDGVRVDKVFLASDGQSNEGISNRAALLRAAQREFGPATVSTFGIGDDYDEGLMTALAAQAGGRTRFIRAPGDLPPAIRAELLRASAIVARSVRLEVRGLSGARVERVLGYDADGGWVRLPDFAAGEERRVLVKLSIPPGHGLTDLARVEVTFSDAAGAGHRGEAAAQATFTSNRTLLGEGPTEAARWGAEAEMAVLAQEAAEAREQGRAEDSGRNVAALQKVAARAQAAAPPPVAAALAARASEYGAAVGDLGVAGGAASKELKQRAFDSVRAPVSGWSDAK